MKILTTTFLVIAVAAGADKPKNELPANVEKFLRDGTKMQVLYLDGTIAKKDAPAFHDYKIVGEPVNVEMADKRKQIVDAIVKDVRAGDGGPRDFKASHGVRVFDKDGNTIDILIGDSWLFVFQKNEDRKDLRIKNDSMKDLDSVKPK